MTPRNLFTRQSNHMTLRCMTHHLAYKKGEGGKISYLLHLVKKNFWDY